MAATRDEILTSGPKAAKRAASKAEFQPAAIIRSPERQPTGDRFRTYKFGYTKDNPSYDYLRFRILGEVGGGSIEETFYTLNLTNAHAYFFGQFRELNELANEYIIKDEFDVFVAFETMKNRGKNLSDLEFLKNRLIYLTTLYSDGEHFSAHRALHLYCISHELRKSKLWEQRILQRHQGAGPRRDRVTADCKPVGRETVVLVQRGWIFPY